MKGLVINKLKCIVNNKPIKSVVINKPIKSVVKNKPIKAADEIFRRKRLSTGTNFFHIYLEIWDKAILKFNRGLNSGSILTESLKTLLCTYAPNMNAFCYVTEIWKLKKNHRSVTRTFTYRTNFRTEITKLKNSTNKAIFTS